MLVIDMIILASDLIKSITEKLRRRGSYSAVPKKL